MTDSSKADRSAEGRASRQHGAISHAQATSAGLTDSQIKNRVDRGRWRRAVRGVYVSAGAPPTWQQACAVACLAAPLTTVASHLTAAALFGLAKAPDVPHITIPPRASGRQQRALVHRSAVDRLDRCRVGCLPATTPARTLVDCAGLLTFDALCDMVDTALYRRLTSVRKVRDAIGRRGPTGKGVGLLDEALLVWDDAVPPGSPAEARVLRWLSRSGFPRPERQYEIAAEDGQVVAKGDFVWPERMVLLEYDGEQFHGPRRWRPDDEREGRVVALGWTVLRADKHDFRPSATRLLARLRETLGIADR